jgi:hypothetical protein
MVHSTYDGFLCTGATLSLFQLWPTVSIKFVQQISLHMERVICLTNNSPLQIYITAICQNADKCVHVEQGFLMNDQSVITMAAAETEVLAGMETLVATTSQRQTGTHNNQL